MKINNVGHLLSNKNVLLSNGRINLNFFALNILAFIFARTSVQLFKR